MLLSCAIDLHHRTKTDCDPLVPLFSAPLDRNTNTSVVGLRSRARRWASRVARRRRRRSHRRGRRRVEVRPLVSLTVSLHCLFTAFPLCRLPLAPSGSLWLSRPLSLSRRRCAHALTVSPLCFHCVWLPLALSLSLSLSLSLTRSLSPAGGVRTRRTAVERRLDDYVTDAGAVRDKEAVLQVVRLFKETRMLKDGVAADGAQTEVCAPQHCYCALELLNSDLFGISLWCYSATLGFYAGL